MSMMSKFYDAYLREENTCSPERYAINDFLKNHMTNEGDIIEIDELITMSEDKSTEIAFAAGFKSAMMFLSRCWHMAKTNQSAERFNESIFLRAEDVQKIMQCSRASAYRIIQQLNKELEAKGKITVRGRVSKKYFMERIYG